MIYAALAFTSTCLGYTPVPMPMSKSVIANSRVAGLAMLEGTPRPVQIIPSVLPADWANSKLPIASRAPHARACATHDTCS